MKIKKIFLLILFAALYLLTGAQNKIGNNPGLIHDGSLLELESLTKGLRLPRIPLNNVNQWTLDGTATSGMIIYNESGTEAKGLYYWNTDASQWVRIVNKSELSTLIANYITQNTSIKDSIVSVVNNTIVSGDIKGKDITSNSQIIKILNGTGSVINATQLDIDKNALGGLLNTSPVSDSLSVIISTNTVIRDSIVSLLNKATTNSLLITNGTLTSTVNGVTSSPGVPIISSANNGLTGTNGNLQLGGSIIKPTTLSTTATNTLSITGLQAGDITTDDLLTTTPGTGIVRKISSDMLGTNVFQLIAIVSANGQKQFATPHKITDIKKIQVFRNGINVEFTQVDDTHIELENQAACYAEDEVKIIQLK